MSKLFYSNQTNGGSLYITMKRIDNSKKPTPNPRRKQSKKVSKNNKSYPTKSIDQPSESSTSSNVPKEYYCLIRVHDNKRKISTIVSSKDVNKFQQVCCETMISFVISKNLFHSIQAYSNLLKGNLHGLKKKDKKKSLKKSKATQ